jgi:hypothetical protein
VFCVVGVEKGGYMNTLLGYTKSVTKSVYCGFLRKRIFFEYVQKLFRLRCLSLCLVCIFMFFLVLVLPTSVFAVEGQYADVIFDVQTDGSVIVSGTTNSAFLEKYISQKTIFDATSKQGKIWTLNISEFERYDDIIYEVRLPQNAMVFYVDSSVRARIFARDGRPVITGLGENDYLRIVVQYEIFVPAVEELSAGRFFMWLLGVTVFGLLIFFGGMYFLRKTLRKVPYAQSEHFLAGAPHIDTRGLSDRQEVILKYIIEKGSATQTELSDALGLPKAAVSRNVHTLETRKIVKIISRGMSNVIVLEEPKVPPVSDGKFVR